MTAPFPGDDTFEKRPCLAGRSTYAKESARHPDDASAGRSLQRGAPSPRIEVAGAYEDDPIGRSAAAPRSARGLARLANETKQSHAPRKTEQLAGMEKIE
jgi:hypothetical protein